MVKRTFVPFFWLLGIIGLLVTSAPSQAQTAVPNNQFDLQTTGAGKIISFVDADISFSENDPIPRDGWSRRALPAIWLSDEARKVQSGNLSVRARVSFDSATFEKDAISIFTENNRERISVSVNGTNIFRNYADSRRSMLGWNHPYLIPVSNSLLKPGANEIVIHAESGRNHSLGIGTIAVGNDNALGARFESQYFFRIDAPKTLNWIMLLLSVLIFIMWLGRRTEMEIGRAHV